MQPNREQTSQVWRHYVSTGSLPRDVLRRPIERAWQRCQTLGASPFVMQAQELGQHEKGALLGVRNDLIESARPYMAALSEAAGDERHAAMLGDRDAVVLDVLGDEESLRGAQRVPGPGALLAEAQAGANGIGSPLAEGDYIELVGPEHFIEGFHPFTCQGLPLHGPEGETIGVLSSSVRRVEVSQRIREILVSAARGIEAELMRRRLSDDVARLLASHSEANLLHGLEQDVVQLQGAARLRLERAVRLVRKDRPSEAAQLLNIAAELIRRFRRQSQMWRQIAGSETGAPQTIDLVQNVQDMAALIATEASVRGLAVETPYSGAPIPVFADPRRLHRALFRALLQAFESAVPRSTVRLEPAIDERNDLGVVRFAGFPEITVTVPRRPRPLADDWAIRTSAE